jgi:type I restriction enzyme, S subunit
VKDEIGGWVRLGDCCRVVSGTTPDINEPSYWGGDVTWITPTDLGRLEGMHIRRSERTISPVALKSHNLTICPVGSLVLSSRAPIGHLGIADVPVCTNQGCKTLVPGQGVDSEFLYYSLLQAVPQLQALGSGATFAEVSKSQVERFEIYLPTPERQAEIAAQLRRKLDAIHDARRASEERLAAAESLRASAVRSVFDSDQSQDWPRVTVDELRRTRALTEHQDGNHGELHPRNKDFVDAGVRFATAKHLGPNGRLELERAPFISKEQASRLRIGFAKAGDVLLAHNASVGPVGCAPSDCEPFVVGTSLTIYRADSETLDPQFLFWALQSDEFQRQLFDAMKQTTRNQVPITRQRELSLPLPPITTQRRIAADLCGQATLMDGLRRDCREELAAIESMPRLFLRAALAHE